MFAFNKRKIETESIEDSLIETHKESIIQNENSEVMNTREELKTTSKLTDTQRLQIEYEKVLQQTEEPEAEIIPEPSISNDITGPPPTVQNTIKKDEKKSNSFTIFKKEKYINY
jgi:hypothetical protein